MCYAHTEESNFVNLQESVMKLVSVNQPGIALEKVLLRYGFSFAHIPNSMGMLRLLKSDKETPITCGCVMECAEKIVEAKPAGSDKLVAELQAILDKFDAQPFVWNAAQMINVK